MPPAVIVPVAGALTENSFAGLFTVRATGVEWLVEVPVPVMVRVVVPVAVESVDERLSVELCPAVTRRGVERGGDAGWQSGDAQRDRLRLTAGDGGSSR